MSRLARDGTTAPVSRNQILRRERGQGNIHVPCSANHEQDWKPYPVDPYSAKSGDRTYIQTETCIAPGHACILDASRDALSGNLLFRSLRCTRLNLIILMCFYFTFI